MAIPFQITGAGNQDAQYVFRVAFSQSLALPPAIEAWDNAETFPDRTDPGATTALEVFTGTTTNSNLPMLYAVSTTNATPGDDWKPTAVTAGGANPNRLEGTTSYVIDPTIPETGDSIYFNLGIEVPYDVTVPSTAALNHIIQIRLRYSGSVPSASFYANEGTETSPTWTELTPGTHGIRYCNAGTNWDAGDYELTLPESGLIDAPEIGITS